MPKVLIADSAARAFTGGAHEFDLAAATVSTMIAELDSRFPGLGDHIERRMAIAIDGEIHQDAHHAVIAQAREVVLIPRIGGG